MQASKCRQTLDKQLTDNSHKVKVYILKIIFASALTCSLANLLASTQITTRNANSRFANRCLTSLRLSVRKL